MVKEKGVGRTLVAAPFERYIVNPHPYGLAVISKNFAAQPEARKLQAALDKAALYIGTNPDDAKALSASWTGMEPQQAANLQVNRFETVHETDRAQLQRVADLYLRNGLLTKRVDVDTLLYR